MTLELVCELAIAVGLLWLVVWLRHRFQEIRRGLRGVTGLAIKQEAELFRLREALQPQARQEDR